MISIYDQILVAYGYLHSLWRYRWSALTIAWLVAIAGWLVVYSLPNVYSSRAAIHIDTSSVIKPLLSGLVVQTNPEQEFNVMTRMMLNRENLLTVIRETDMDHDITNPAEMEKLIAHLARNIQLKNVGGVRGRGAASIYEVSYQSSDAEMSFKVVFNLLNTLIEGTLNSGQMDTVMAEEFLNEQIRDYEKRLEQSEQRLAEFKKKNVGFMPDTEGGYYAQLSRLKGSIDSTTTALRLAKQRYNDLRQQLSGESPLIGSSSYTSATAAKLRTYQEQLNDMLTQFTEEHPDVKALRARIEDLQKGIDTDDSADDTGFTSEAEQALNPVYQDIKAQESRARVEVSTLQVQLAEQRQKLEDLKQSVDIIPQVEADLAKLNRDYDITKSRYLSLVERRESARLAQKVEKNNSAIIFRVVDAPVVPLLPSGPNRPLLLSGVFFAALFAGLAWSVLRFLLHPTFVDYKQLQKIIDLPVLGAISLQITSERRMQRRVELTSFLLVVFLMFGIYGGVLMYQQQGSDKVRTFIDEIVN
jgi:polysaccharide chain length determinant protein (PEP-CTERM system associated)